MNPTNSTGEKWKALVEAATPGPWACEYETRNYDEGATAHALGPGHRTSYFTGHPSQAEVDAAMVGVHAAERDAALIIAQHKVAAALAEWVAAEEARQAHDLTDKPWGSFKAEDEWDEARSFLTMDAESALAALYTACQEAVR